MRRLRLRIRSVQQWQQALDRPRLADRRPRLIPSRGEPRQMPARLRSRHRRRIAQPAHVRQREVLALHRAYYTV
jgi:hypothetical protein